MNLDLSDGFLEIVLGITALSFCAACLLIIVALVENWNYRKSVNQNKK
jgi:hypothetical protein